MFPKLRGLSLLTLLACSFVVAADATWNSNEWTGWSSKGSQGYDKGSKDLTGQGKVGRKENPSHLLLRLFLLSVAFWLANRWHNHSQRGLKDGDVGATAVTQLGTTLIRRHLRPPLKSQITR